MAPRIRIKRTRKPALYHKTRQLFALGDLCTNILRVFATYSGGAGKEAYTIVQTENRAQDTRLKTVRESLAIEQARRLELLYVKERLELEARFPGKVAPLLGEKQPPNVAEFDDIPHSV